ncbi:MAG TPA: YHS domain-containing (seleno)protein [Usitatibacter sp.]|nr:YHS domain-containing (seleno)protein [Usitatibacter sp.]
MTPRLGSILATFAFLSLATFAHASNVRVVAKGHDPVAYFTEGKPVKGDPRFAYEWDDGLYHFASARNRDTFAADPDRYAPRFGGYCTGSLSAGKFNEADPNNWVIAEGRLYLFGEKLTPEQAKAFPEKSPEKFVKAKANWDGRKR